MPRIIRLAAVCIILAVWPGGAVCAADHEAAIKQAIERGVAYLKSCQNRAGTWTNSHQHIGATALAALTLVECDVPADDPAIQSATAQIRAASPRLDHTYSLALNIMFLDRLGAP